MTSGWPAMLRRAAQPTTSRLYVFSSQASAEHFQQCAEFPLLRNCGLRALAVSVLAIPLARRAAASFSAAVQDTGPFSSLVTSAPGPGSALPGCRYGVAARGHQGA
jgi:hypothetical protein